MTLSAMFARLDLTGEEVSQLVDLLLASAAGIVPGPGMDPKNKKLLEDISAALYQRQPIWHEHGGKSCLWSGRLPAFMPMLLPRLQRDAEEQRANAVRATRHLLVTEPPVARAVAAASDFMTFVADCLPATISVERTSSFYHYYEKPTDRVEPHIDVDDFMISCLMLVDHQYRSTPRSRFYICGAESRLIEVELAPGDAIVFHSGGLVHARSAPGPGEQVITASWGFRVVNVA